MVMGTKSIKRDIIHIRWGWWRWWEGGWIRPSVRGCNTPFSQYKI